MKKKTKLSIVVPGFRFAALAAGIKPGKKPDLALILAENPVPAAAVFTSNRLQAAPVLQGRSVMRGGKLQAILVNAGCANAATGARGLKTAFASAKAVARQLKVSESQVLVSSTGKIGEQLELGKILSALPKAAARLSPEGLGAVARAIMTTDAFPKLHAVRGKVGSRSYTVAGVAKGAGMIEPHMATMLAYVFTDLDLPAGVLKKAFQKAVDQSFNAISVDGDTSTNDTAVLLASGASRIPPLRPGSPGYRRFERDLLEVCQKLAWMMVQDGEGATKVAQIRVQGAKSPASARKIAYTIARSPLVKTSFFGEDPNWGRVFAAVGNSGETFDPSRVDIFYGSVALVKNGAPTAPANRKKAHRLMRKDRFEVTVELRQGRGEAEVWTSDLGHGYVKINAEYN